jgi:hypothetical protein
LSIFASAARTLACINQLKLTQDEKSPSFAARGASAKSIFSYRMAAVRIQSHTTILTAKLTALFLTSAVCTVQSQSADPPDGLFQRVKARMAAHLAQLPNYTCHETIQRMLRARGDFRHLDTVELDVAFVGQQELFSRPGEDKFGEQPVEKLVSGGTIGNSALGSHIDVVFSQDAAEFKYVGECKKDGRKALRFDLRVPMERSTFWVKRNGQSGRAGYEGSVWVDAETLDLVRVDIKANRIPNNIGVRLVEESMHYKKLTIGNSEFHLPGRSELTATDDMGHATVNLIELTGCREFAAESVVRYGAPTQGTANRDRQDR